VPVPPPAGAAALAALLAGHGHAAPPPPAPPAAPAAVSAPPWRPTGAAAVTVTGPVILSPEHLVAGGADFPLRLVAQAPVQPRQTAPPSLIFAVTTPMNPPLLGGNRLCGPRAPTWIVAAPIAPSGLEIAVFAGPSQPTGPNAPGVCATFFYNR
jgi:hypothetical protein